MKVLGKISEREIVYQQFSTEINWSKEFPARNWLLLVIVDDKSRTILDEIARKALNNSACFICCLGKQAENFHDLIDEIITYRIAEIDFGAKEYFLPDFQIDTTWHTNFEEGFWFATSLASHEKQNINTVFCLDAGKESSENKIAALIENINQGWIPK